MKKKEKRRNQSWTFACCKIFILMIALVAIPFGLCAQTCGVDITGPHTNVDCGQPYTYSLLNASCVNCCTGSYSWQVNGGTIVSQSKTSVTVIGDCPSSGSPPCSQGYGIEYFAENCSGSPASSCYSGEGADIAVCVRLPEASGCVSSSYFSRNNTCINFVNSCSQVICVSFTYYANGTSYNNQVTVLANTTATFCPGLSMTSFGSTGVNYGTCP